MIRSGTALPTTQEKTSWARCWRSSEIALNKDVLNSTDAIKCLESMDTEVVGEETIVPEQLATTPEPTKTSVVKAPMLSEGKVSFASAKKMSTRKSTAREVAESIVPTVIGEIPANAAGGIGNEAAIAAGKVDSEGSEGISEADNFDSVSFTSSIFSDGNDSFDARNVTLPSGRLDIDKLMSWSLPTVNLSRVLDRSACKSPGTRNKILRLIDAQKGDGRPSHSTPAVNISTCRKKGKKTKKSVTCTFGETNALSERESIKNMLQNN